MAFITRGYLFELIDLEKCPPNFASELTRAANTQNRIRKKKISLLWIRSRNGSKPNCCWNTAKSMLIELATANRLPKKDVL